MLVQNGQQHLFANWKSEGVDDEKKHIFFSQVKSLHESYLPAQGGLVAYIRNAQKLLIDSKNGVNPLDGWKPEVPHSGVSIEPMTAQYDFFDNIGLEEVGTCGFVLVAGGLGERLGYNGIKIELPTETTTSVCYIELYCHQILAIQTRYRQVLGPDHVVPLAIMVSDDTATKTEALLQSRNFFGLNSTQVTLMKQEKVAALIDNDARLSLEDSDPYLISAKPHGHGDVHSLLHNTGTAAKWLQQGIRWCYFFQDTNGLALNSLSAMLGVSVSLSLEVNSRAVPRYAKQAVGAIVRLVHVASSREMTVNVEYNQLDPLLRSTISPEGDVNDQTTGLSAFPGNINQLLLRLEPYIQVLQRTHGVMGEFVNPKYADLSKTRFKKPTRLECMMQDYPRELDPSARVGYTVSPSWSCYSPVKNNTTDAAISVASGVPAGCAMTGESDQYFMWREMLRRLGCHIPDAPPMTIRGITATLSPQIVFHPTFAIFPIELTKRFPSPHQIHLSDRSTLVIEGNVKVESLTLDGSLRIINKSNRLLVIRLTPNHPVRNDGQIVSVIPEGELKTHPEATQMRGYVLQTRQEHVITCNVGSEGESSSEEDEVCDADFINIDQVVSGTKKSLVVVLNGRE
jgi:UDP-sugar pyrophosphorylase